MNNKRKFFTTLLCVATLTTGLLISGCSVNKVSNLGSAVSSVVGDNDEKAAAKLNTLIDATNQFNSNNAAFAQFQADGLAQLKGSFQEGAITNQPHYDRLQDALEKSKKEGSTFKDLDAERDNLLNVLNELVPVYKELTSYNDSKAYMNDGGAKGKELAAKYVASVEKFDAAYAKFSDVLTKTNNEQTQKQVEKLKKEGKKGYAAAMESTLRLTNLVENLEKAPQKADKAAVEKELSEIDALLKSVNNDRGQVLADRYNSVVGSVRQVLADSNENNLDEMIQSFNAYIDTYNSTNPEQFDGK